MNIQRSQYYDEDTKQWFWSYSVSRRINKPLGNDVSKQFDNRMQYEHIFDEPFNINKIDYQNIEKKNKVINNVNKITNGNCKAFDEKSTNCDFSVLSDKKEKTVNCNPFSNLDTRILEKRNYEQIDFSKTEKNNLKREKATTNVSTEKLKTSQIDEQTFFKNLNDTKKNEKKLNEKSEQSKKMTVNMSEKQKKTANVKEMENKSIQNKEKRKDLKRRPKKNKNKNIDMDSLGSRENIYFKKNTNNQLKMKIEKFFKETSTFNEFNLTDSFIRKIKYKFGDKLTDKRKTKWCRFINLKIVWCQFLCNEKINQEKFKKMNAFEKILLQTFLKRNGYLLMEDEDELTYQKLSKLNEIKCKGFQYQRTEKEMLDFSIKQVFKKLMYSYFNKIPGKEFFSDMRMISLNREQNYKMFQDLFSEALEKHESVEDFFINEHIMSNEKRMIEYIQKMSRSKKIKGIFADYLSKQGEYKNKIIGKKFSKEFYKRHKYDIADKLNKRINNYEIILNQFDPDMEESYILEWLGIIIKDLALNPRVKIPWNISDLDKSMTFFLDRFYKKKSLLENS